MSTDIKVGFKNLLNQRYKNARKDMQQMNKIQEELDFNKRLQEELTQKPVDDDDDSKKRPATLIDLDLQELQKNS